MTCDFQFSIESVRFDEAYQPSSKTRITTNFANLARGENRQQNLRNVLRMIDRRCNSLACWDNPAADRYRIELDIVSVGIDVAGHGDRFPMMEILKPTIIDTESGARFDGIVGNNLSSYVRDYDFSILLAEHNAASSAFSIPSGFGALHGRLFMAFVNSDAYINNFGKPPVICLSVSHNMIYRRLANNHPILGVEYQAQDSSLTERYFARMGLRVRYFMPPHSVAPLAFFCSGDLLNDYTPLELIGTISTMETFQKIYRPEIYNANSPAGECFQPSLRHQDYSPTRIEYDRDERDRLAVSQGRFADTHFITPYRDILARWSTRDAA